MLVALALLLTASVGYAAETAGTSDKPEGPEQTAQVSQEKQAKQAKQASGPIIITSDTLRADGAKGTATFSGSVVATGDELHMEADTMKVYYAAGGGDLERIEASGSVKLVRENRIVTSEQAIYDAFERKMTFTGNARAVEDGNVLVGTKITYMIDEDRYEVEGSKIFIESTTGRPGGGIGSK